MKNECKQCNVLFIPKKSTKGIFCSLDCYHKSMVGKVGNVVHRKSFIAWNKGQKVPQQSGTNHFAWKGENVSYRNLHRWVERNLGRPLRCDSCGLSGKVKGFKRYYDWANISHKYFRELTDWKRMCKKCHRAYDKAHRFSLI